MTKASIKKSWIILISACLAGTAIALACAGDYGPEYGTSNFTPEIFVDKGYSPFFYSQYGYYGIGYDDDYISRWNKHNIREWSSWLGDAGRPAEVDYLLDTADAATIGNAVAWFDGRLSAAPGPLADYRLFADRHDKKAAAFLHYLTLAKQCEQFTLTQIYHWDRDTTKKQPFGATLLDKQLLQGLNASGDNFLQERYWFQLMRSHFFNGTPAETIRLFETWRGKFPVNLLWYRSMAYMAGACFKLKAYHKANYYYSRIFDSCPELRTIAHQSFSPKDETDWSATLELCRNNEEKATLWQMVGIFYSDPVRAIGQIYQLDPHSDKLEVLLSRAINASEQRFGENDLTEPADMPRLPTHEGNDSLGRLVARIAVARNTSKPWIWQQAAGYLCMLDKDYDSATAWYKQAALSTPQATLPQAQLRMLRLINTVASAPSMSPGLENKLVTDMTWLFRTGSKLPDSNFRHESAIQWLRTTIAAKYKRSGDAVKAECWKSRPDFYVDSSKVEALKAFLAKSSKTPWESFCASVSTIQLPDIYEYQAITACLDDRIDDALTAINHAPAAASAILPGNPFNARINDCHDCDHAAPQKIKYSKLSVLQKLRELKAKIAAGTDVYTNAILVGNAQYNCTWYGNARAFYDCRIIVPENGSTFLLDSSFDARFTSMKTVVHYYSLALNAAQTNEQRARCQYLLAKCQRNTWYNSGETQGRAFTAFDGFKNLKQYANTDYYKEVIRECGYFKTYIRKNP